MSDSQYEILIKSGSIAGVSLILGLLFDFLLYGKVPGISFPIYVLLMLVGFLILARIFDKQIKKDAIWLFGPIVFFSSMVLVRASVLLTMLNIAATFLLLLLIAGVSVRKRLGDFLIGDYIFVFFLPFMFIIPMFNTLFEIFSMPGVKKDRQVLLQVIKGITMAVPILVLLILLLSSADLVFHKYVSDLLNLNIKIETLFRATLVVIATLSLTGAYAYMMKTKEQPASEDQSPQAATIGQIESAIVLGSISVLFLIFIIVQLTYLFGGQANISAQGFTYAEYARRGFFELIAVAIISLLLLLATEKYVTRKESGHVLGYKLLSTILVVEVIVIMISAFTRLLLYEKAYGFTTLRLYSHAFIIFLAVIFCSFLYKIYVDERKNTFALRLFMSITLFVVAMNLLNPDAFIARRNIERYHDTNRLDVRYLSSLSDDAIPDVIKVLDDSSANVKKNLALKLSERNKDVTKSRFFNSWQSTNVARIKAKKILDSNISRLRKYGSSKQ